MHCFENTDEKTRRSAQLKAGAARVQQELAEKAKTETLREAHSPEHDQAWGDWNASNAVNPTPPAPPVRRDPTPVPPPPTRRKISCGYCGGGHEKQLCKVAKPWKKMAIDINANCRLCNAPGWGRITKFRCNNKECELSKKAYSKTAIAKSNASENSQGKDARKPPSGAAEAANPYSQALTPPPPRAPWHSAERNFDTQARSSTDPNPLFPLIEHQTSDQLAQAGS